MDELIIKEREFKKQLVNLINKSELPAFILKPIFKDLAEQLKKMEGVEYENAKKEAEINGKHKDK